MKSARRCQEVPSARWHTGGPLCAPNVDAIRALASLSGVPVVASGGVTDIDDVARLDEIDLMGVVIGRAIYEGNITLSDALTKAGAPA